MNGLVKRMRFQRLLCHFVLLLALGLLPPATAMSVQGPASEPSMPNPPPPLSDPGTDTLHPHDLQPAESCGVPAKIPFGQDVEIVLAPWSGYGVVHLDQPPAWQAQTPLPGTYSNASDFDAVFLGKDEIVAAWKAQGEGVSYLRIWEASSGWGNAVSLGATAGRPILFAPTAMDWIAFARDGHQIKWSAGVPGNWQPLPGIDDAASDPAVASQAAGHMALFYRDTAGTVVFSEWEGAWLSQPIPLTQTVTVAAAPSRFASELSAISRNDSHMAVFGVDEDNQLWVRERTNWNEADWSDTRWVKLMEDVAIARPGVASRHPYHLGVVVRDTSGVPYYIEWMGEKKESAIYLPTIAKSYPAVSWPSAPESANAPAIAPLAASLGWKEPLALGAETEAFASPMTLVARSVDSLSVLGARPDNRLYEKVWTDADGWAEAWQDLNATNVDPDRALPAVVRHMHDFMVLGRSVGGSAWYKHYTNRDQPLVEEDLDSDMRGIPRAQALAKVDGKTVWVSVNRDGGDGTWRASAWEIAGQGTGYLELSDHGDSGGEVNRVSVAAADLDVDGDDEVVVATLRASQTELDVSVLELSFPTPPTSVLIAATTTYQGGLVAGDDVNVALGDLDGDYQPDEVAIGYRSPAEMRALIFEYQAGTGDLAMRAAQPIPYVYNPDSNFGVLWHDMELAIGHVSHLQGEQLVAIDAAYMVGSAWRIHAERIIMCPAYPPPPGVGAPYCEPYHLRSIARAYQVSPTWTLDPLAPFLETPYSRDPAQPCDLTPFNCPEVAYSAAVGSGDLDADGRDEVAYGYGAIVATVDGNSPSPVMYLDAPSYGVQSLAAGDLDWDGRAEIVTAYPSGDQASSRVYMVEMVDDGQLRASANHTVNVPGTGTALVGDVDDDSHLAELVGCQTVREVTVIAVVNGVPRWYEDDGQGGRQPIHDSQGSYAIAKEGGSGSTYGTTTNLGSSLSVGFEQEISVFGFKIAEFRSSVTQDFMHTMGQSWSRQQSQAQESGYSFGGRSEGMVIYNSTDYTCYYYDVFAPDTPEKASRAMVCQPMGGSEYQGFCSLEHWRSQIQGEAGMSWADVGHRAPSGAHTNDLQERGNYATTLPVDPALVRRQWSGAPFRVCSDVEPDLLEDWYLKEMESGAQETTQSFETNTTVSVGATVGSFTVDSGVTVGWGREESHEVSWGTELSLGGGVYKFTDLDRPCYDVVPFIYHARARTRAGVIYPYIELDYYVPWIGE
jgi:hypothetical protein